MGNGLLAVLTTAMLHPGPPTEKPLILHDKSGEPFGVRAYEPGDRDELLAFYEAFEPKRAAQGLPPGDRPRIERWLATILPSGIHLLAHRRNELIGHALVVPTHNPGISEYAVFLREDLRGRGVGTELNRAAIQHARATGLTGLWLTVEPHNRAAIRSYEKSGFRLIPGTHFSAEAEMALTL